MNRNHVIMIICISLLLLPLSSCSKTSLSTDTSSTDTSSIDTSSTDTFPTGTFMTKSGSFQIIITDNDSFTFLEAGYPDAANFSVASVATYSIHANEITIETDSWCDRKGAGKATYTWIFENNALSFTLKGKDKCIERACSLIALPFHKKR